MDAVADVLQPYKEIVGYIVTLVTVARLLAGSLICWDIYKQKSTKFITITPFLLSLCLVSLNLKYGFILHDSTIVRVSTISIFVNTIYCLIYLYFSHEKLKVTRQISVAGALTTALIAYAQREDPYLVKNRLGVIITIFYLTVIASPLLGLKNVLQNQSTEGLPFPHIASGVAISSIWMVYGTILRDRITVFQQIVALLISSAQLLLFVIYPSKPKSTNAFITKPRKLNFKKEKKIVTYIKTNHKVKT